MAEGRLLGAATWGAQKAPDWFVRTVPALIGVIAFFVASKARRSVFKNVRRIYAEDGFFRHLKVALGTFVQFAYCLTEALAPERFFEWDRVTFDQDDEANHILETQAAVLATAHVGPWDSSAMALSRVVGAQVLMLMAGEPTEDSGELQDDMRRGSHVFVVRLGRSPLDALPALHHLEAGGVVVGQMDRVFGQKQPLLVPLFGQPFEVPSGLIRLAGMTQVPLIPVFHARLGFRRRLVRIDEAIWVPKRPTLAQQKEVAERYAAALEAHLRRFPTQWFHFVTDAPKTSK